MYTIYKATRGCRGSDSAPCLARVRATLHQSSVGVSRSLQAFCGLTLNSIWGTPPTVPKRDGRMGHRRGKKEMGELEFSKDDFYGSRSR